MVYEPKTHTLQPHLSDDIRAATGLQDFVGTAPLNLVYVADGERMTDVSPEERRLYASVDTGFIGQNVYLFCASEGLASVFRAAVDYAKLARLMRLPEQQFVTFAQTVGYPRAAKHCLGMTLYSRVVCTERKVAVFQLRLGTASINSVRAFRKATVPVASPL